MVNKMQVSINNGIDWKEVSSNVRIIREVDGNGTELHVNLTSEGFIVDVYDCDGNNIGTDSYMYDELIEDIVGV